MEDPIAFDIMSCQLHGLYQLPLLLTNSATIAR